MSSVQPIRRSADLRFARIEGWLVDVAANRVQRGAEDVRLTPKAMAVLRELLQRHGAVVRRDDLLGIVWRDGFPTDDVLTHAITELRRAIEDDPRAPRIIETIPKVGYRLLGNVEILAQPEHRTDAAAERTSSAVDAGDSAPARVPLALLVTLVLFALLAIALPLLRTQRASSGGPGAVPDALTVQGLPAPQPMQPFAVTADPSREQFPSLSPDGSTVAYSAMAPERPSQRIMLKSLEAAAVPVALTSGEEGSDDFPVWSPDGKQIAFLRSGADACSIQVMPALGGQARRVAACPRGVVDYIDWHADGRSLLLGRRGESHAGQPLPASVHRLELDSGRIVPIAYAPQPVNEDDLQPRMSPDGRWIVFRRGAVPYSDLYLMPAAGGDARRLTTLRAKLRGFAWYPDSGALVLSSDHGARQSLFRLDLADGRLRALGIDDAVFPAMARKAPVLVYQQEAPLLQLAEFRLDTADGVPERRMIAPATRSDRSPSLSPGAAKLAFVSHRSGEPQLWIHEFDGRRTYPVTRLSRLDLGFPQWSPDEANVLFVARGAGASTLMRVDVGSGRIERLSTEDERVRFASYSRDGRSIFFSSDRSGSWQIWRMAADGSGAEQLGQRGGFDPRDFLGDGAIYFTRETEAGLFRLDLATKAETRVSNDAGYLVMETLMLVDGHAYFLEAQEPGSDAWIVRVPLHPEGAAYGQMDEREHVFRLNLPAAAMDVSLSRDRRRVVVVSVERDETDLMAMTLAE